ncbi:MAG: hypothetical protein P8J27_08210 [Mariniblastus sp.]|nr:hypothetical protein [Mariniblastus sp.]
MSHRVLGFIAISLLVAQSLAQESHHPPTGRQDSWKQHQKMALESPFNDLTWQTLGPKFAGGRIESIDAPRGDLGTIYVGVGAGGIWKTTNGGLTWKPIFNQESTFAIGDLTIAPNDPSTIWVGTGECHVGRMSYSGTGVFKSEDAGQTWTNMGLHESFHIGQIAIDPQDSQTVYVAAMGSRRSGGQRGIFKTTDGGKSFRHVLKAQTQVSFVDLVIDPSQSGRVYASAWDRGNGSGSGVYRSDDNGESWTKLRGGLLEKNVDRVAIAVSASNPGIIYALMADRSTPNLARRRPASILFRSDDFGETWKRTHENYVPTYVGWDFCDIRVAPDDADRVYIGGFRLIISPDGGKTFVGEGGLKHNTTRENVFRLHYHEGKGLHLDVHDIWIDPQHPERVMLGNDGGLFSSTDRGKTWLHLNNLPIAEFYRVHLDDQTPFQIWGGTQDNASFVGPSTASFQTGEEDRWKQVFLDPWSGGDGFATFPDPHDPTTVFFTQQNGELKRAKLGDLNSGRRIRPRTKKGNPELRFAWDTPFFASKHSEKTVLYCAAQTVFKSQDRGNSWESISPNFGGRSILALAESPLDPNRLIAGDGRSQVHFTLDAGQTWKTSATLPAKRIGNVIASHHDPNRAYVVQSGRVENDFSSYIHVTHDSGKTWKSISANLPHESVNAMVEDPKTDGLLFVGTDLGCYVSSNMGERWESLCHSLPTAAVVDVQIQARDGALVAATHGLSLFLLDIKPIRESLKRIPE